MKREILSTRKRAWFLLKNLGSHPAEVAEQLIDAGVQGFRGHCNYDPIARYLEKHGIYGAYVTQGIFVLPGEPPDQLPAAVARFRVEFDAGKFPLLEVPG